MRRGIPWIQALLALLVVAGFMLFAYEDFRRTTALPPYDTFSTYDPSSGGYEAWYELLRREGVRAQRFERRPAFLDDTVDVFIVANNRNELLARVEAGKPAEAFVSADLQALHDWVAFGGRLVWLSDGLSGGGGELELPTASAIGPRVDDAVPLALAPVTAGVRQVSGSSHLRVAHDSWPQATPLVGDDTGAVVTAYQIGKGWVLFVSDESLFQNRHIAKADNARLAFNLAAAGLPGGARPVVTFEEFTHGYAAGDSFWAILPVPMRAAFLIAGAALLSLLIGAFFRFGPVARLPDARDRTSAEYLASMAILLARGKAAKKAVRDLAESALREVAGSLGLAEKAPARALAARVAAGAGGGDWALCIAELDRVRALESPGTADLVRAAQLAAILRKEFKRHGRLGFGRRESAAQRPA